MANWDVTYDSIDALRDYRQRPFAVNSADVSSGPELTYTASLVGNKIRVSFSRPTLDSVQLRLPATYTVGLPAGAGPVTITAVEMVPSLGSANEAWLTFTGELVNGATYTVTLAFGAARDYNPALGGQSISFAAPFTGGGGARPSVVSVVATSTTTVLVKFSEAVRQVSSANTDDALRPANYVIPTKTVSSVASIDPQTVLLTLSTAMTSLLSYSYTISNIKDLAGNVVL